MITNRASYSNNFATVLRVGRAARLDQEISPADRQGHEPLPKRLAKARVAFGADSHQEPLLMRAIPESGGNEDKSKSP